MRIGIDIVENIRVEKLLNSYGRRFLTMFLTTREINQWERGGKRINTLCGIFAAKEAIIKAVDFKINLSQVTITHTENGVPVGSILKQKVKPSISISHEIKYSVAVAICD